MKEGCFCPIPKLTGKFSVISLKEINLNLKTL
jgi:hypothetical protein